MTCFTRCYTSYTLLSIHIQVVTIYTWGTIFFWWTKYTWLNAIHTQVDTKTRIQILRIVLTCITILWTQLTCLTHRVTWVTSLHTTVRKSHRNLIRLTRYCTCFCVRVIFVCILTSYTTWWTPKTLITHSWTSLTFTWKSWC